MFRFACGCNRCIRSNNALFRMSVIPVLVYASPLCHRSHISCFSAAVMSYHSLVPMNFPSASKKSPPLSTTVSGTLPHKVTSAPEIKWESRVCAKISLSKNGSSPNDTPTHSASDSPMAGSAACNAPPVPFISS